MVRKAALLKVLVLKSSTFGQGNSRLEMIMLTFQHMCLLFLYRLGHCTQPTCTFLSDGAFGINSTFSSDTAHHLPSTPAMLLGNRDTALKQGSVCTYPMLSNVVNRQPSKLKILLCGSQESP